MIRFKDGWRLVSRKAARPQLKIEPYDPDAKDGDGDGIVQEGTAWERPVGTRFLRMDGRPIPTGLETANRPSTAKLVDRDGNPIEYTPTYERPGYKPLGTTIGEQVGSVVEVSKKPKGRKRVAGDPITAKLKGATGWFEDTYLNKIRGWLDSRDQSWRKIKGLRVFDPDGPAGADERIDIDREGGQFVEERAKMFAAHFVAKGMREKGVDFSKVYPSWEPIIDFKTGEVSLIQIGESRDGLSLWLDRTKDWVRVDRRDPRYEELRSEGIASALIQRWAAMSDTDLQLAAGRFLGDVDSAGMYRPVRDREFGDDAELMDAMIQTMHEEAQKMLSDMGIDQMRLYRGMSVTSRRDEIGKRVREAVAQKVSSMPIAELREWLEDEGVGFPDVHIDDLPIPLHPISSFSTYYPMAKQFAQNADGGDARLVFSGSVPISRIVGIPGTGIGCFQESEFVVLTGDSNRFGVEVDPSRDLVEEIARERGIWEQMYPEEEE